MERKNIKCHFISNTHWDREWKFSAQRTRHMLVTAIDMLLDIFEKEPDYKHFHLDSQTLPIQDYLEINPEKKEILKKRKPREKESVNKAGHKIILPTFFLKESRRRWFAKALLA